MKKINTIVFDFDGTIADTNNIIMNSWQAVFKARRGEEGDPDYILSTFGEPLYLSMEKTFPEFDLEETVSIYRDYQKTIFRDEIAAFPGMVPLIKDLKEAGFKIGIATSRLRATTLIGMEVLGLDGLVDALVTVEDTDKHKPDPEPALICLEKLKSLPEESLMVGDSAFDMGCGKNAGMITVMVAWSQAVKAERESEAKRNLEGSIAKGEEKDNIFNPDYIIEEADDLWQVIKNLNETA